MSYCIYFKELKDHCLWTSLTRKILIPARPFYIMRTVTTAQSNANAVPNRVVKSINVINRYISKGKRELKCLCSGCKYVDETNTSSESAVWFKQLYHDVLLWLELLALLSLQGSRRKQIASQQLSGQLLSKN